ncbi:alpha/beta hydrolase [Paraburkholderia sediminicola]|uniref:alpha/beta hydrolase n=1 Tax=Paraburkholderia sediminicola TaxID=458836 RepID=UPI0038B93A26
MSVIPSVKRFLDRRAAAGAAVTGINQLDPRTARDYFDFNMQLGSIPARQLEDVEAVRIGMRDGAQLNGRIYYPRQPCWADPLPALLYFHSGGYVVGSLASADSICRMFAADTQCAVVSVDYRLAPEHKFPYAVNDAVDALSWLHREAGSLALDGERLAVGGESSGATLAAVCAVHARDAGIPLALQMLIYPALSARTDTQAHHRYGEGYFLTLPVIQWIQETYLTGEDDTHDWRFAPLDGHRNAPSSWTDLAPAWLVSAEYDPLQEEHAGYAARLRSHGNQVEIRFYPGMIHGFFSMGGLIPEAAVAHRETVGALREAFGIPA